MIMLHTIGRWLSDLLFRNWSTKAAAFALTLVLFVSTRDEVTRTFEIPVRVTDDPQRVLLTDLPRTVQIQVRGPWTRLNRLQAYDFGSAVVDLENASPGPLTIDRASIVMPSGVVLSEMQYDAVDLRFEPVVTQDIPIAPSVRGQPAPDREIIRVEARPELWAVRGGRSRVQAVEQLATEPIDIEGAVDDVEREVIVLRPSPGVTLEASGADAPSVRVRVVIEPAVDRREFEVPVDAPANLPGGEQGVSLPSAYEVFVDGPVEALRQLDTAGPRPVVAQVRQVDAGASRQVAVEVRFDWSPAVPPALRQQLSISPRSLRVPDNGDDVGPLDAGDEDAATR